MAKRNIFRRLGAWFKKLFGSAKAAAEKYIPVGIAVVEEIKKLVDSPATPLLTMLIPGTLDDVMAAKVKEHLPKILATLKISNECARKATADEVVQCTVGHLRKLRPGGDRHDHWLQIAAKLSAAISDDGKLDWTELLDITQDVYDDLYVNK